MKDTIILTRELQCNDNNENQLICMQDLQNLNEYPFRNSYLTKKGVILDVFWVSNIFILTHFLGFLLIIH